MNAYAGIFRMTFIRNLQYRAAAWAGVATQFCWGLLRIAVFFAFYQNVAAPLPMTHAQTASYLWLEQAFLALFVLWWQDGEMLDDITSGRVAYEFCRPYWLYGFWFMRLLSGRLSRTLLRCLPILLITGLLLQNEWRMTLPASPAAFVLFALSMAMSALLVTAISMLVYVLTFLTLSPGGARLVIGTAAEFLGGMLIPIPLMPEGLQRVLSWLPFRYISDLPLRVYSGHIPAADAVTGILVQAAWIAGFVALGALLFARIRRRVVIQGG